jgi:hypothetical protein
MSEIGDVATIECQKHPKCLHFIQQLGFGLQVRLSGCINALESNISTAKQEAILLSPTMYASWYLVFSCFSIEIGQCVQEDAPFFNQRVFGFFELILYVNSSSIFRSLAVRK